MVHAVNTIRPSAAERSGFNFSQSAILSTPVGLTAKANSPDINPAGAVRQHAGRGAELTFTGGISIIGYGPYNEYNRNYTFFDNVTWIKGRHTFKFGVARSTATTRRKTPPASRALSASPTPARPAGTTAFQQSWANFLLGNVATFTMPSTDITPNIWAWQHEAYAQDDFKVSPRLTVYMGVRWSLLRPADRHQQPAG